MALSDYTSPAEVRAALGVSDQEVSDDTLALDIYENHLVLSLDEVSASLAEDIISVKRTPTPSKQQASFLRAANLYCTYTVAQHLTTVLPIFSPQSLTDGKAGFTRFGVNPYEDVAARVGEFLGKYAARLREAYAALNSTSATSFTRVPLMAVSSPSSDPVTGS